MHTCIPIRDEIRRSLDERGVAVILDLSGVRFFGSGGIATVVEAHQGARRRQVAFAVVAVHRPVVRPLEVTGVTMFLALFPTLSEALAAVGPTAVHPAAVRTGRPGEMIRRCDAPCRCRPIGVTVGCRHPRGARQGHLVARPGSTR
ncbi:hypothetical protein ALI22I_08655 [Saccharothrix sp. ALI-22-I]|nr:hypothetical protein ALI22I_08655 [Saccharothrix sp. ALI-22-I]